MRVRSIELSNAGRSTGLVAVGPARARALREVDIPNGSTVHHDLSFLDADLEETTYLMLVDSRPEIWDEVARRWLISPQHRLEVVAERADLDVVIAFLGSPHELSLIGIAMGEEHIRFVLVAPQQSDRPIDDLLFGLRVGADRDLPTGDVPDPQESTIRERYRQVLESIAELPEGLSFEPSVTVIESSDDDTLHKAEKRIERLQVEHDALRRKYDALANSKLGALTLRRWEKRRSAR
ncbi:hypothetical protein EK0264_15065 [Epidermidibacterium keratini]|uniref:Uncharacterized protein n=1 Tax=Epidermidibacterium keratini TaxID=1891644 RepID=A0A7L4YRQ9_9ACTN|nr:hypothetical protein [Epidermidibacterium keratini]QHC01479.1 hypothetical protein EK0264_15065 [Epidermidibacterium keratini]